MSSKAEKLVTEILRKKTDLFNSGKKPRLVLLGAEEYAELEDRWLQSIKDLPWGDTLEYELEQRKDKAEVFLADGTLYGLWVVRVNTIEGFKVY